MIKVAPRFFSLILALFFVTPTSFVGETKEWPGTTKADTASRSHQRDLPDISEQRVNGWVKIWSERLALSDWQIQIKIVRLSQLPKGTIANIHWSLPRRAATIKVLDPADSRLPREKVAKDTELSIVHELVHLSMAKLLLDSTDTDMEEQVVKKLSTALMELHLEREAKMAHR